MTRYKYADVLEAIIRGDDVEFQYFSKAEKGWRNILNADHTLSMLGAGYEVRIKPKTIMIGDTEVPEPLSTPPKEGSRYYVACPAALGYQYSRLWVNIEGSWPDKLLKARLIHLNKEDAIQHAKALIKISGGSYE